MSDTKNHWRELILKSGPNTDAREALISEVAERLDEARIKIDVLSVKLLKLAEVTADLEMRLSRMKGKR